MFCVVADAYHDYSRGQWDQGLWLTVRGFRNYKNSKSLENLSH